MDIKELEKFIDIVYKIVGEKYSNDFKHIIGGCHCCPATEWYGEIYLAFNKLLHDNVIKDKYIKAQIKGVFKQLSKDFGK
jgi:hypothetical protein